MIDYGDFQFAGPPGTGSLWFSQVMRPYRTVQYISSGGVYVPFEGYPKNTLRVSLVRHPCDWLSVWFDRLRDGYELPPILKSFFDNFDQTDLTWFIKSYLDLKPGAISKLFLSYDSDSYLRTEDLPWAVFEFMEMVAIPNTEPLPATTVLQLASVLKDSVLYHEVIQADKEMVDAFDYF